jgi:predicted metal-dependent HD superfamily phosphohydrolase
MNTDLLARFVAAWGDPSSAERAFADLERRYAAGGRAYHDLRHVDECLRWVDAYVAAHAPHLAGLDAEGSDLEPADVQVALFFHDAVLQPGRQDNEAQSAELFQTWAHSSHFAEARVERIRWLILATTQTANPKSEAAQLVHDADFAILGAPPERYAEYAAAVQCEFSALPGELYRLGRAHFLRDVLRRPALYQLPFFRESLEQRARSNLRQELQRLAQGGA